MRTKDDHPENPIDRNWAKYPLRRCSSYLSYPRPCAFCRKQVQRGERYFDGGTPTRLAHERCVVSLVRVKESCPDCDALRTEVAQLRAEVEALTLERDRWRASFLPPVTGERNE